MNIKLSYKIRSYKLAYRYPLIVMLCAEYGTGKLSAFNGTLGYEFAAGNVPLLTENIVPVFSL